MSALLIDTETTGLVEPELIELAMAPCYLADGGVGLGPATVFRFKSRKPISLGALATHHIMDEELADLEYPPATIHLGEDIEYLLGYNVDFDWKVLGSPPCKRIDVLSMARTLWPDADSHTQGAILYMLERDSAREMLKHAHSAATDIQICLVILGHAIAAAGPFDSMQALWQFSEKARIPKVMPFGKHKGVRIAEVPRDYCAWLLKQPDVDPYLAGAVRARL